MDADLTDLKINFAIAQIVKGILKLSGKDANCTDEAFRFLLGKDVSIDGKNSGIPLGIAYMQEDTEQAINLLAEGLNSLNKGDLDRVLLYLNSVAPDAALQNAAFQLKGIGDSYRVTARPQIILQCMESDAGLSFLDRYAIWRNKEENPSASGVIEQRPLGNKEKLRIALVASIDDLLFKYVYQMRLERDSLFRSFARGVANYVSDRQIPDSEFAGFDKPYKRDFEMLIQNSGFDEAEKQKIIRIFHSMKKIAGRRFPFFYQIGSRFVDGEEGLVNNLLHSQNGIRINKGILENLSLYLQDPAPDEKIIQLSDKLVKSMEENADTRMLDLEALSLAKQMERDFYNLQPAVGFALLLRARKFISRLNRFASLNCSGAEGYVSRAEAEKLLRDYFENVSYPFDEQKLTECIGN